MKMDVGKYRGRALSEVPTEYLEWASVQLPLSAPMWDAVMAEQSRRANAERVQEATPAQTLWERPRRYVNRLVARFRLATRGY